MCRLAVVLNIPKHKSIRNAIKAHFYSLEQALGGDGNGIYLHGKGKVIKNLDITPLLENELNFPVLFHTRAATVGEVIEENCHPYELEDFIFAHNGGAFKFNYQNGKTDSFNLFREHIETQKPLDSFSWWGNIIMADRGSDLVMFFVRNTLKVLVLTDGSIIVTSQKTGDLESFINKEYTMREGIYISQFQNGPKGMKIHKISNIKKSYSPYKIYKYKTNYADIYDYAK